MLSLSPSDREKITQLLTSLDENTPLTLNIQSQEIVWKDTKAPSEKKNSDTNKTSPSLTQNIPSQQSKNEKNFSSQNVFNETLSQEKTPFFSEKFETKPKDSFNARNINFSSSHLFPKEKEDSQQEE
ncbi:MAG: hypothetical protein EOM19_07910 [Candidatus Moranbacteria bacterium]|nr:hypothetical protein [Candidatus Moranbacteria bacterium]